MPLREDRPQPALDLQGHRVVVTAGGTRAPIDPIRFIGKWSSPALLGEFLGPEEQGFKRRCAESDSIRWLRPTGGGGR